MSTGFKCGECGQWMEVDDYGPFCPKCPGPELNCHSIPEDIRPENPIEPTPEGQERRSA